MEKFAFFLTKNNTAMIRVKSKMDDKFNMAAKIQNGCQNWQKFIVSYLNDNKKSIAYFYQKSSSSWSVVQAWDNLDSKITSKFNMAAKIQNGCLER